MADEFENFLGVDGLKDLRETYCTSLPTNLSDLKSLGANEGKPLSETAYNDLRHQQNFMGFNEKTLATGQILKAQLSARRTMEPYNSCHVSTWGPKVNSIHYREQASITELVFSTPELHRWLEDKSHLNEDFVELTKKHKWSLDFESERHFVPSPLQVRKQAYCESINIELINCEQKMMSELFQITMAKSDIIFEFPHLQQIWNSFFRIQSVRSRMANASNFILNNKKGMVREKLEKLFDLRNNFIPNFNKEASTKDPKSEPFLCTKVTNPHQRKVERNCTLS